MIRWQKTSTDGGLFNIETIRLTTYQIPPTEDDDRYISVVSSENGTEAVGYYKTEQDATAGHATLCRNYGLK